MFLRLLLREEEEEEADQSLNAMWDEWDDINFEHLCNMSTVSTLVKLTSCIRSVQEDTLSPR